MKKTGLKYFAAALMILALMAGVCAAAEEAAEAGNITEQCEIKPGTPNKVVTKLMDGDYTTYWTCKKARSPQITITSETPMYGLYLCYQKMPETYELQVPSDDGESWETLKEGDTRFHHVFYELDGLNTVRIQATTEGTIEFGFNEIFVFGEGKIPDWVQRWEEPVEKADIMFLAAHPDDELLFFGGAIPTYAAELKRQTLVVYLCYSNTTRRSEALNGLWAMGVRNYPIFGGFRDVYSSKVNDAYKSITGGKKAVQGWLTEIFRKYRPEVVVTHDIDGEYGHGEHKMLADAAMECYDLAADPAEYTESGAEYGLWQVKKLYLHLWGEEGQQTILDWSRPLESMGGKTGIELATEAFALHVSQAGMGRKINGKFHEFSVEETGGALYPNTVFGLCRSEVGEDAEKNDFLENISEEDLVSLTGDEPGGEPEDEPEEEPEDETGDEPEDGNGEEPDGGDVTGDTGEPEDGDTGGDDADSRDDDGEPADEPEEEPAEEPETVTFSDVAPAEWADVTLNERGFLDEGEYVLEDDENGHYMFVNSTIRIVIERKYNELQIKKSRRKVNTEFYSYCAHVWCDVSAGELPHSVFADPEQPKVLHQLVSKTAAQNRVVFATSTDYYTYRLYYYKRYNRPVGIIIRDGEIFYDLPYKKPPSMPNYETLALYRDGHVESWLSTEKSAQEYLDEGAYDVFCFGPCLVRDGVFTQYVETANESLNPRYAFGMVEPGHYVALLCEGRVKRSDGVQMKTLAQMMVDEGCQVAVNLDGGQTAVFAFMGKQLNEVVKTDPHGRAQAEILAMGTSDQVEEPEE